MAHEKEQETNIAWLNDLAFQGILLQEKPADTLVYPLGAVVSLAASKRRKREEVSKAPNERDEYHVKLEEADGFTKISQLL